MIDSGMLKYGNMKISAYEYFLGLMFIILCGFTAGGVIPAKTYILLLLGIVSWVNNPRRYKHSLGEVLLLCLSFILICIAHYTYYSYFDKGIIDKVFLILCGYFVLKQLKRKFCFIYFKLMYYLAFLSIICYILQIQRIIPDIPYFYKDVKVAYHGIFFWNVRFNEIRAGSNGFPRNCGPFWEPGAFSGYLLMIPVLYFNNLKLLWDNYRKESIVLIITFLTTFSTQGYVGAFILGVSKYISLVNSKYALRALFSSLFFVYAAFISYETLPFLKEKIDSQLDISKEWNDDSAIQGSDRFSTTMLDLENIGRSPLVGNTTDYHRLYRKYPILLKKIELDGSRGSGSGMTSFMAEFGILLWLIWLALTYKSLSTFYSNKRSAFLVCLFLIALGQGESYITQIFYLSIPFLFMCNRPGKTIVQRKNEMLNRVKTKLI